MDRGAWRAIVLGGWVGGGGRGKESDMTEWLTCLIQHRVFHSFSLCELLCTNWDTKANWARQGSLSQGEDTPPGEGLPARWHPTLRHCQVHSGLGRFPGCLPAQSVMPDVRIPEWEERRLPRQGNSQQKREVYYWLEPGLLPQPTQCCRVRKSPEPQLLHKFIGWT